MPGLFCCTNPVVARMQRQYRLPDCLRATSGRLWRTASLLVQLLLQALLALGIDLIDLLLELLHLLLGLLRLVGLQLGGGGSGRAAVAGGEGEQTGEKQGIAHGDLRKWAKANPSAPGAGIQQSGAPTAQP